MEDGIREKFFELSPIKIELSHGFILLICVHPVHLWLKFFRSRSRFESFLPSVGPLMSCGEIQARQSDSPCYEYVMHTSRHPDYWKSRLKSR